MSALLTPGQVQQELRHRSMDVYMVGFRAGEASTAQQVERAADRAIGIGLAFGFCFGIVACWLVLGFVS